jgi:cysteine-rich repeat protein
VSSPWVGNAVGVRRTKLALTSLTALVIACGGSSSNDPIDTPADAGGGRDTGIHNAGDSGTQVTAVCGNNQVEAGEACDDGNTTAGDGCDGSCRPEAGALGCRSVAVSTGEDGEDADDSVFLTTAFGQPMKDVSEFLGAGGWKASGPITLCASAINGGKAALTLRSDVTMAISLPLNNCLCRQFVSVGTTGTLYCGPSSDKIDFTASVDSAGAAAGTPAAILDGASAVTGEGHVRISFQSRAAQVDAGKDDCTPAACEAAFPAGFMWISEYTTGQAISEMTNTMQGGTISITASGHAFDSSPSDGTPDCEEWVSGGGVGALAGAALSEEDNEDVGSPKDVVTIERIAE